MAMIFPDQPQQELQQSALQTPLVYQIVVSEQLPCFDPTISIKHLFMSYANALELTRFGLTFRPVFVLVYLVGLMFRIVDIFLPRRVGEILAMLLVIVQFPTVFLAVMAFRWEYVKVLICTFEFCFLASTITLWVVCAFTYTQDLRAVLLPVIWIDFINFVLIETYFGESKTVFVIAIASGLYLMLLTGKISLNEGSDNHNMSSSSADHVDSLSVKDALVNAMGTMMTLVVRLAYRKYKILKRERRQETMWARSISYRCRIALASIAQVDTSSSRKAVVKRMATTGRRQPMRFVKIPALFHSENTVVPRIGSASDIKHWQICVLYGCGVMGYAISTFVMIASTSYENSANADSIVPLAAIMGLITTLLFWLYFVSCCQRQLLVRLCTSFDFLFLLAQLIASDVSACDILKWRWTVCCGIFAELLWVVWVLLLDTLTPAMKTRLKLKVWHSVLVLVLHVAKQVVFFSSILVWKSWSIQNRVLSGISLGGHEVQFRVFTFAFSRHLTILIWCVRILYRIASRKSDDDLVLLLGNVEYNCEPITTESIVAAIATLG